MADEGKPNAVERPNSRLNCPEIRQQGLASAPIVQVNVDDLAFSRCIKRRPSGEKEAS